jgi:hypothetical protein
MRFTVLAVRMNSPSSGRSSISSAMVWDRSPLATAPITRAASAVGLGQVGDQAVDVGDRLRPGARDRTERRALVDLAVLADDHREAGQLGSSRSFISTTSLKVSATLPGSPSSLREGAR